MENPGFTLFRAHLPGRKVTNGELPEHYPNIEGLTSIKSRYISDKRDTVEDIAYEAVRQVLDERRIKGNQCAALILANSTLPNRSAVKEEARKVANRIGITDGMIDGVHYACCGFAKAVELALARYSASDKEIIVVAAEIYSRLVDWSDKNVAILFGDGAAATTIAPKGDLQILDAFAETVDDPDNMIRLVRKRVLSEDFQTIVKRECVELYGAKLFKTAPRLFMGGMRKSIDRFNERNPNKTHSLRKINKVIPHQANGRMIDRLKHDFWEEIDNRDVPVINEMQDTGNTGGAALPIALARSIEHDQIKDGDLISCPVVGGPPDWKTGKLSNGGLLLQNGPSDEEENEV